MRRKGIHAFGANGVVIVMSMIMALCLGGCGKEEAAGQEDKAVVTQEVSAEVSEEQVSDEAAQMQEESEVLEESAEDATITEEQTVDAMANLSNEEWVKSLNVERPTFLVFNSITGERKALEDGAEYTLVEGDELAIETPKLWFWNGDNIELYSTLDKKYNCIVYTLNYELIDKNTEFTVTYLNPDNENVTATVYLSK